jgi:hypothetical protein
MNIASFFIISFNMKLLPSHLSDSYSTLNDLVVVINEWVGSQEYAVIKKRTKINKKEVVRKAIFRCDRGGDLKPQKFEKRETSTRSCDCSFEVVVTLEEQNWIFKNKHETHNHVSTLRESHPVHRKLALTAKVKQQIAIQTLTKTAPRQILINLNVDQDEEDSMIKARDVYNQRQKIRHETLRNLTVT